MVDNDVVTISCNGKNLQGQSYTSYLCWAETKESSRSARFMLGGIGHGKRLSIFSGFTLRCIKWEGHQVGVYIEDPESAAADSEKQDSTGSPAGSVDTLDRGKSSRKGFSED